MRDGSLGRRRGERGFALILAILSLMLLTFLGLTLATTTSTELQIATNYRWSQQALYNAEAGLEVGRVVLALGASTETEWEELLPERRMEDTTTPMVWLDGAAPGPPTGAVAERDWYRSDCDTRGGLGYGRVLAVLGTAYEHQSSYGARTLNGAYTLWVRRDLTVNDNGEYSDSESNKAVILVAEGVAPYTGQATAFTAARQARRVLEVRLGLGVADEKKNCEGLGGQEGLGPSGANYNPCAPLVADPATGEMMGLEGVFGPGVTSTGLE